MSFDYGYALLIGVGTYEHNPPNNVPNVVYDAEQIKAVLTSRDYCGYKEFNVELHVEPKKTTRAEILAALDQLAQDVAEAAQHPDVLPFVMLVYGGHGGLDAEGNYYLCCSDSRVENGLIIDGSGIRQDVLLQKIQAIPTDRMVLIFNACHSGHISPDLLAGAAQNDTPTAEEGGQALPDAIAGALVGTGRGRVIITACRQNQKSYYFGGTEQDPKPTFFGEKLVAALRGEDLLPRHGAISALDLYACLHDTVSGKVARLRERFGGEQHPELTVSKGVGVMAVGQYRGQQISGEIDADERPDLQRLGAAVRELSANSSRLLFEQVINMQGAQFAQGNQVGRDLFQIGRDLVRGDQYNIGQYIVSDTAAEITPRPEFQARRYVARPEGESLLKALCDSDDSRPVVILYGAPGTGRTALAGWASDQLFPERFPGGVLSVNAAGLSRSELLHALLSKLGRRWYDPSELQLDPGKLWSRLQARHELALREGSPGRAVLVLIDDMERPEDLAILQPTFPTRSRLLAVSSQRLDHPRLQDAHRCRVGQLSPEAASKLFGSFLSNPQIVDDQKDIFDALAREALLLPALIRGITRRLRDEQLAPAALLRRLRQAVLDQSPEYTAFAAGLARTIADLTPGQRRLLALVSLIDVGDEWESEILARVALVPPSELRDDMQELLRRDIIFAPNAGYRINPIFQRACADLLANWPSYERDAAWQLLARACLDHAQDVHTSLSTIAQPMGGIPTTEYLERFQRGIAPQVRLLKSVIDTAVAQHSWWIIERLALLPYLTLFQDLILRAPLMSMEAIMATVDQLYVARRSQALSDTLLDKVSCGAFAIVGVAWSREKYVLLNEGERDSQPQTERLLEGERDSQPQTERLRSRLKPDDGQSDTTELYLALYASRLISPTIIDVDLVDSRLIGVRAERLAVSRVNMTGANLVASKLSQSFWYQCDASQALLTQADLSGALLRKLRLRGADLSGANLSGAILDNVDLHGANLSGANLSGALMRNVRLSEADLEGVEWGNAIVEGSIVIDDVTGVELPAMTQSEDRQQARADLTKRLREGSLTEPKLKQADLSGTNLAGCDLNVLTIEAKGAHFIGADLSGAWLQHARLPGANLTGANLANARLQGAELPGSTLVGANLFDAKLGRAKIMHSDLRLAYLTKSFLASADLGGANLTGANLSNANLSNANLTGANLTGANLEGAIGDDANFSGATVSVAQLLGLHTTYQYPDNRPRLTLPSGAPVADFDQHYTGTLPDRDLSLAILSGQFENLELRERILSGAILSGRFERLSLNGAILQAAQLSGHLKDVTLVEANLIAATLSGKFTSVDMRGALLRTTRITGFFEQVDLRGADFRDAVFKPDLSLLFSDLSDAVGLEIDALSRISRLRGSILPDGTRYDGRFDLPGDSEDARAQGIDLADPAAREGFYRAE